MMSLGAISGATTYYPPLPSPRLSKLYLKSVQKGGGEDQVHKVKGVGYWYKGFGDARGSVSMMQGDGSITELGRIMEVAMLGFNLA